MHETLEELVPLLAPVVIGAGVLLVAFAYAIVAQHARGGFVPDARQFATSLLLGAVAYGVTRLGYNHADNAGHFVFVTLMAITVLVLRPIEPTLAAITAERRKY